jgi:hypothetical protein
MKKYWGSGSIASPFLTSALDWVIGQHHAPSALSPPQSLSELYGVEAKICIIIIIIIILAA